MLLDKGRIHFIGIGGIGMSAIARILLDMGCKVSGSDLELNDLTKNIERLGGSIFKGHRSSNLSRDVKRVVYSTAIPKENPELLEARRKGIPIAHRAEMLAELFNKRIGIAVTGTHGKTTTASLISVMLERCSLDPTVIIGGEVSEFNGNAKLGRSRYLVAEADESDESFLHLRPQYCVITNIEREHLEHFKTMGEIRNAYRNFLKNLKRNGIFFYNRDDPNTNRILNGFEGRSESFGLTAGADIYPVNIKMNLFRSTFEPVYKNRRLGRVEIAIPGRHNILNTLAVILVGLHLGLSFEDITKSIKGFHGARRRFHLRSDRDDIMLIDDYAHHPTEIKAVLDTCRNWKYKRLVVVFQPHRYTRTKFLADDFARCLNEADKLVLTDIYAASERAIEGVSVKNIYDRIRKDRRSDAVILKKDEIPDYIISMMRRGDMIIVLGAGDIKKVSDLICEKMKRRSPYNRNDLAERLESSIRGRVIVGESLRRHTTFKLGGRADIWVEPRDIKELKKILYLAREAKAPIFVIGNGSNILIRDSGFRGMVIRLAASSFKRIEIKKSHVEVGAGYSLPCLVRMLSDKGLGGVESLVGIPGTMGGAVYMNAGGQANPMFRNIGDIIISVKVMDYKGRIKTLKKKELKFGYRRSNLSRYIILKTRLKLNKVDTKILKRRQMKFLTMKKAKQVLDIPSAGCVFKNPEGFQFTCGQMIDMLGLKGKRIGGAQVSAKHANFIVNRSNATASDVLALIEFIKAKVKENYNIELELEIKVV